MTIQCKNKGHISKEDCSKAISLLPKANYNNLKDINNFLCPMEQIKFLIIRIRRLTRIKHKDLEGFLIFRKIVKENMDFILNNINLRWQISIMECYADQGNDKEKGAALVISALVIMERMNQFIKNPGQGFQKIYKGLRSMGLGNNTDVHINFSRRLKKILEPESELEILSLRIINDLFKIPGSLFNTVDSISIRNIKKDMFKELEV